MFTLILGCSGDGAASSMLFADIGGWVWFVASALLMAVGTVRYKRRSWRLAPLVIPWLCMLIHPVWWLGVTNGDCGGLRSALSVFVFLMQAGILFAFRGAPASLPGDAP